MTTRPPIVRTDTHITVLLNGSSYTVQSNHPNWNAVRNAVAKEQWDQIPNLASIPKAVNTLSKGLYEVTEGAIFYNGPEGRTRLPAALESRVLDLMKQKEGFEYLLRFNERLARNPSASSVEALYTFLEHKNIPIGEDGYFYAYKAVRQDWKDIYSGKVDNSIGAKPRMARNQVDDNPDNHCSKGYHVGSLEYVKWYGGANARYLICKIDPADVVSVPRDHSCQKVRVTSYEVISEYVGPLPSTTWNSGDSLNEDENEDWDDEDEDFEMDDQEDDYDDEAMPEIVLCWAVGLNTPWAISTLQS